MPEFRFRRKKQNRRTTLNNPEETAKQVEEARKLVKPVIEAPQELQEESHDDSDDQQTVGAEPEGKEEASSMPNIEKHNSFVQEREKFFQLLKTKYPEQANSLEVGVVQRGEAEEEEEVGEERRHRNPPAEDEDEPLVIKDSASLRPPYNRPPPYKGHSDCTCTLKGSGPMIFLFYCRQMAGYLRSWKEQVQRELMKLAVPN